MGVTPIHYESFRQIQANLIGETPIQFTSH